MTQHDGGDRSLFDWLDAKAGRSTPTYLGDVLARTTRTRQRPAWSSRERWLPMQTTLCFAPVPRVAWLLVVAALVAAVFVAVLVAGSKMQPLPAPFGPARNGVVVFGADNDIYRLDPVSGTTTALITGSTADSAPLLSPDGTRILFLRDAVLNPATDGKAATILAANVDGSNVRAITGSLTNIQDAAWSHDGSKVIVSADLNGSPALQLFSVGGTLPPLVIDTSGMTASSLAFRPGDRELTFRGSDQLGDGLYAVGVDGRGLRTIAPYTTPKTRLGASLSPDGTKLAYTVWDGNSTGTVHVTDVATGHDTVPAFDPPSGGGVIDEFSGWSPDGSLLMFGRYHGSPLVHFAVAPSIGGRVVEIGPGRGASTDYAQFSPDGMSVLAYYGADTSTWLLDPAGLASDRQLSSAIIEGSSWQRLAP